MWLIDLVSSFIAITIVGFLQSPMVKLHALTKRTVGSVILLIPFLISIINQSNSTHGSLGISFNVNVRAAMIAFTLTLLIIIADYFAASNKENLESYPPIRASIWSPALVLKSFLTWILYLICYESIFRGIFFFISIEKFGIVSAVLLNTTVCSLAHLMKSQREALLSIPMGLLLCYIAWTGGSFWYAAFVHTALALAHEIFSIHSNPKMHFELSPPK